MLKQNIVNFFSLYKTIYVDKYKLDPQIYFQIGIKTLAKFKTWQRIFSTYPINLNTESTIIENLLIDFLNDLEKHIKTPSKD